MSVIIRLQNLPWSANALDIRQYFRGLSIPEGGVHIVGGEQGDAFIAFSTDEDARQAMMLDGGKIKEVKIKLFLSSRAEMQKVIEHARQQSMSLQNFMQMPAPPLTPAPMSLHSLQASVMNQVPTTAIPSVPVSSAPITSGVPEINLTDRRDMDRDKKDTDSVSSVNKDSKRDRKERSRSRDGDRRDSRKDRDRDRHRDRDRDRDRRRRDRSRSRERSSRRRDRRDRSRTRERSRSRDHTSKDRERDSKRNNRDSKRDSVPPMAEEDKNKDQNGDVIIINQFPPGKDRIMGQTPAVVPPNKTNAMQQQPTVNTSTWDTPSAPSLQTFKTAGIGNRPLPLPMDTTNERQLDSRRILGSASFTGDTMRPLGMGMAGDSLQGFSRREAFPPGRDSGMTSMALRGRESWPPGRPGGDLGRFARNERLGNFSMNQGGFNNEPDDFERELEPRASFRGGYRAGDFRRGAFPPRDTRLGGPNSMLDRMGPGSLAQNELDDRRAANAFPPSDRRVPFRMDRGDMDSFQRMDRFDQFDRNQMNDRQFNARPAMGERFPREKFGTPEQNFDLRPQFTGNCVEIRNMPIEAGYGDIRRFFQGLHITSNGLKIINDNHGNRVGIAYVKFQKREGKEEALAFNGRAIRGSPVEVLHLNEDIFEKAIDSFKPAEPEPEPEPEPQPEEVEEVIVDPFVCLCIKDIPPHAKEPDISKLFSDIPVSEVIIAQSGEAKQCDAYIKFDNHESAKKALNSNTKYTIGQKPVTLAPCTLEELEEGRKHKKIEVPKVEEPKPPTPTPETKPEPAQNAKPQDPRSRTEAPPIQEQPQKVMMPQSDCILLRGLPVHANDRDILDFFSDVGLVPLRIHIMLDKFGKPIGDAFCEFNTAEEAGRAFTKNGTPLGKQEVSVKPVLRAEMNEALGLIPQTEMPMSQVGLGGRMQQHGREFGGRPSGLLGMTPGGGPPMGRMPLLGRHPGSLPPGAMQPGGQSMDAFGNPGCVVSLENIPFRADIDEILDFLADFDVNRENVMRRFTDKGLATGDARVAFMSPSEAQRAIRELRFRKIRGRPIYLKLLN